MSLIFLQAGGAGVEYYFGYSYNHSDLTAEDYRSRAIMWDQSRYALEFFSKFSFWNMTNSNQRVSNNNWCLLDPTGSDTSIALFLPSGGTLDIDLRGLRISGTAYSIAWYDPRNGGDFQNGTVALVQLGMISTIGLAPSSPNQDWAVLLKCLDCFSSVPTSTTIAPITTSIPPTFSPSVASFYPSLFPSEAQEPSNVKIIPETAESTKPSSVTPINTNGTPPSLSPRQILSMVPIAQSSADDRCIQRNAFHMVILFFGICSSLSVVVLGFM